jgi:hypothetical protein
LHPETKGIKINKLRGSRLIGGGAIISDIKEEDDDEIEFAG